MDQLIEACGKRFSEADIELLKRAVEFARKAHEGQLRESKEPYYIHPKAVAIMLNDMGMDLNVIIAGLLHDTVEDNDYVTIRNIKAEFGDDIAEMVDGVPKLTKSGNDKSISKEDRQAENFRKMFLAIAKDVRVVIIKLADRLHNMRTLEYCDPDKRVRKARETLEVYAPLAHRFGMGAMKVELEDLAFEHLHPDEYKKLKDAIEPQQRERMSMLMSAMSSISEQLRNSGIKAEISGRRKHLYSIYKKLKKQDTTLNEIYDLIAIRVIVNTVKDCYEALGIIHSMWPPMPGRVKDYIAMPKTNQYRSLHTTVFGESGIPFEVQIRTHEMHKAAEYGIAAHWMYKEGRAGRDELDSKLGWLREALEYEDLTDTTREFIDNVKKDFFSEFVFVLTPKGEIIDLPTGSTPVDFAYRIHTNVGNHTQGARVNDTMVKLDYKLKNHDKIEIITSSQAAPSRDWLRFVKTQQAKAKIRNWFKKANREENVQRGKEMLADAAKRQGYQLSDIARPAYFEEVLGKYNMSDPEDVYAAIGYGGITTGQVLHKLIDLYQKEKNQNSLISGEGTTKESGHDPSKVVHGVRVYGDSGMSVRFAKCCNPVPGDKIFGYITRGRGVSVHRSDCTNAANLMQDTERITEVEWAGNSASKYQVSIVVEAEERVGLMLDLSRTFMGYEISITKLNANTDDEGNVTTNLSFCVKDSEQLDVVMKSLKKLPSVSDVYRTY